MAMPGPYLPRNDGIQPQTPYMMDESAMLPYSTMQPSQYPQFYPQVDSHRAVYGLPNADLARESRLRATGQYQPGFIEQMFQYMHPQQQRRQR